MWDQIIKWDKQYSLHSLFAESDLITFPISKTEGNYIIDNEGSVRSTRDQVRELMRELRKLAREKEGEATCS